MNNWRIEHRKIMEEFILYLNNSSNRFILKGGTSLMLCYGLTRFSEDIDLDGFDKNLFNIVDNFIYYMSITYNYILTYRMAKDTDTVKRALIHYNGEKPLKVEVSYRRKTVEDYEYTCINNILVYNIENLMIMKINAFSHRDKIRDLFDIVYIFSNYKSSLSTITINALRDAVAFKGLEQFDYLIKDQEDPFIDNDILMEGFLGMYYDLGLQ